MASTMLSDVQDQIQEFWSALFMKELREQLMLGSLVNRDYQGEIRQMGDTVKVSQINAPTGQLLSVGVDADAFGTEAIQTLQVDIVADKRAVAAYEVEDLVMLQSQIGNQDSELRRSLLFAVEKQINDHLYSLVNPSTSTPDHDITGITDFNASQLSDIRTLAAKAKWLRDKGWWLLADPEYYGDLLDAQTMTSSDFIGPEQPVVGGQIVSQRFGFNILEDNSRSADFALAFHPDFLYFVMQTEPTFKLSDLHPNKQFGFVLSVDIVLGAVLGIDGDVKHIRVTN